MHFKWKMESPQSQIIYANNILAQIQNKRNKIGIDKENHRTKVVGSLHKIPSYSRGTIRTCACPDSKVKSPTVPSLGTY